MSYALAVVGWLLDHWQGIMDVLGAIHAFALAVCNFTTTPDPSSPYRKWYKRVEVVGGIVTPEAKQP